MLYHRQANFAARSFSIFAGGFVLVVLTLVWLPAGVFVGKVLSEIGIAPLAKMIQDQWTPRLWELWRSNLVLAFVIAALSTLTGFFLHRMLSLRPRREHSPWLILFALPVVGSPYIVIQGWLNLLGPNTWIQLHVLPTGWSLYSKLGYVLLQVLLNSGLSMLIIHGGKALLDRKYSDFLKIYSVSFFNRLRTILHTQYLAPLLASFSFVFLQAYWHYDAASMLRQNLLSLELMTAFGSFYDNGQAAAIALPACLTTLPLALLMLMGLSPMITSLKVPASSAPRSAKVGSFLGLLLLPILLLLVPLGGLITKFSSVRLAWDSLKLVATDLTNTAQVGLFSGLLLTLVSLLLAGYFRRYSRQAKWIIPMIILALSMPSVLNGIGMIHLRSWIGDRFFPQGPLRLVVLNTMLWSPACAITGLASLLRLPTRWIDEMRLMPRSSVISWIRIAGPFLIPTAIQLFILGFALSLREVPASLLNYSPDGGTIALTIETMLHFEQPNALSALCLAQFGLVVTIWIAGAVGLHCLRKRMQWLS